MAQLATPLIVSTASVAGGLQVTWNYGYVDGLTGFRILAKSSDSVCQQETDAFAQSGAVAITVAGEYYVAVQAIGDGALATDSSIMYSKIAFTPVDDEGEGDSERRTKYLTDLSPGTQYVVQISATGDGYTYTDSDPASIVFVTVDGDEPYYRKKTMGRLLQNPGVFDYTNTSDTVIKSGDAVVVGELVGVAVRAIGVGETGAVSVEGIYELDKDDAAIALGAPVYIVDGKASALGTDRAGYCVKAASASDSFVQVLLR